MKKHMLDLGILIPNSWRMVFRFGIDRKMKTDLTEPGIDVQTGE